MNPVSAATTTPAHAQLAAPLSQAAASWITSNGNNFAQDWNPQNQINSSSAKYLGLNWIFPLPPRPAPLANYVGNTGVGVDTAPTIVNGTVYAITQSGQAYALNAATGDVIWNTILPITLNSTAGTGSPLSLHTHDGNVRYTAKLFNHTPAIWIEGADFKVYAINAVNGQYLLNFTAFTGPNGDGVGGLQGNSPTSFYANASTPNILVDENRGIVITSSVCEISGVCGRCFFKGWDILVTPPKNIWTSYCTPPQHGSTIGTDPMWTINMVNSLKSAEIHFPGVTAANGYTTPRELQGGPLQNVNYNASVSLKNLTPAQLNATLYDDWGQANYVNDPASGISCAAIISGGSTGSTGAGWGGSWVLGSGPTNGMAFVSTNNKDPYSGPCTPGPDLCSACLMAINETSGQWIWWFQSNAHDLWDWDCSWWQAAGNQTINGVLTPVIYKTCKNGYLYMVNALTGHLIWDFTPPTTVAPRCAECFMLNPLNRTQMELACVSNVLQPKNDPYGKCPNFVMSPSFSAGFEDEQSFNPQMNMLFGASQLEPWYVQYIGQNSTTYHTGAYPLGTGMVTSPLNKGTCSNCSPTNNNSSIWGIDAATGAVKWHYFVPLIGYRGGVSSTADLVFATLVSGHMLILNANNGNVVRDFYIGGPLVVLPSIGATASGNNILVLPIIGQFSTVPGDLVSLSLQNVAAGGPVTTTTASGTTTTLTGSAVTSVVTSTSIVTTTVGGASTITLYGVAAVAVIFVIATGYLAMRGRKPAS